MNKLSLEWKTRKGGESRTERKFLDFVIDGNHLSEKAGDYVSGICAFEFGTELAVKRLLLEEKADFPANRRSLYVCSECGDLDCGAISIVVEKADNMIIWKDFGYQNGYSDDLSIYEHFGSFSFEEKEYRNVLTSVLI